MTRTLSFVSSRAGVTSAAVCVTLASAAFGQAFQGTLQQVISTGNFTVVEPPAPGAPELLHISITDAIWLNPGEVQLRDLGTPTLSDRIIFFNAPDTTGVLRANIMFGSDDEQGNLPPNLPAIGVVPIVGQFPEGAPVTQLFTAQDSTGAAVPFPATIFSDGDPTAPGSPSDGLSVPSPATSALVGAGLLLMRRRRA
jgi:hypothetical protein